MTDVNAGRGADPVTGAGRLLAGSVESPELASSLAFRLLDAWRTLGGFGPTSECGVAAPGRHHRLFYRDNRAVLSSLRRAGESCKVEIAFIKSNSSCLSMMLRQGTSEKSSCYSACCSF